MAKKKIKIQYLHTLKPISFIFILKKKVRVINELSNKQCIIQMDNPHYELMQTWFEFIQLENPNKI